MKPPYHHQNPHLDECRRLFDSLCNSIPATCSFQGRWAAVSATLDRLRTAVEEIAGLPGNDLSCDLLRSLSETLSLTLSISNQCHYPDPPSGRLRTQSDIVAAASSLHQIATDADFLIRSGALLDPLIPSSSSRRETLRAEARSLVIRLQIGTIASRIPALDSLISMLHGNEKNVMIAATQGLVPALVRFLDCTSFSHSEAREKAVDAISRVSSLESCRHLVVAEAVLLVIHLSRVLIEPDGSGSAKEKACSALEALTLHKDIAMTVGSGGTISVLLEICSSGTPPAQAAAAGVLRNLSSSSELQQNIIEENAIPILIRVLRSGTLLAQQNSASCLSNLTSGEKNEGILAIFFHHGILDCIRDYWEASALDSRDMEPAIRLLRNLSSSSSFFTETILSFGFLQRIILSLDSSSSRTKTEAARAVSELTAASTGKEGLECAVPLLVSMLEAKMGEEKGAAAEALASLMPFSACRRLMRKDEKGVHNLIMLLKDSSSVSNAEKKHVVSVLLAVAQSRRCRKLMVSSGARGFLQRLEEEGMQVEGTKKLSNLLAKGKILGVIPWN